MTKPGDIIKMTHSGNEYIVTRVEAASSDKKFASGVYGIIIKIVRKQNVESHFELELNTSHKVIGTASELEKIIYDVK